MVPIKNKLPALLLVVRVRQGENIPHPIPDHMITSLILVGTDNNLYILFPINAVKFNIAFILLE